MYRNSFNVLAAAILSGQRQPLRVSISNRNDRNLIVTGHSYPRRPVLDTGLGFPWSAHLDIRRYGKGRLDLHHSEPLSRRVGHHPAETGSTHVADFGKKWLVYAERHGETVSAIAREKLIKKCRREWKSALIKAEYPHWSDFWNLWFPGGEAEG
jgi:putative endonuclease